MRTVHHRRFLIHRLFQFLTPTGILRASVMIGAGLLLQALTLLWAHPLAFVPFLVVGCPLIMVGIALYSL